jgi:hypothetical protein
MSSPASVPVRIERGLARDEDQSLESHARRIRTDGLWQVVGVNSSMSHQMWSS